MGQHMQFGGMLLTKKKSIALKMLVVSDYYLTCVKLPDKIGVRSVSNHFNTFTFDGLPHPGFFSLGCSYALHDFLTLVIWCSVTSPE